jgi:hypothetical protein
MDLGSFRHSEPGPDEHAPVELDFSLLMAALQAFQASSATARAHAEPKSGGDEGRSGHEPLVELLVGGPKWREAVSEQGGSFNRFYARQRVTDA